MMEEYTEIQANASQANDAERFDWDCEFDVDIVTADPLTAKPVIGSTYEVEVTQIIRTTMTTLTTLGTLLSAGVDVRVTLTTNRHEPGSWSNGRVSVHQDIPNGYVGIRFHKYPQNIETDSGEPVTPGAMAQLLLSRLQSDPKWRAKLLDQMAPLTAEQLEVALPQGHPLPTPAPEVPGQSIESQANRSEPRENNQQETSEEKETLTRGASSLAALTETPTDSDGPDMSTQNAEDRWVDEDDDLDNLRFDADLDTDIEQTVQALQASSTHALAASSEAVNEEAPEEYHDAKPSEISPMTADAEQPTHDEDRRAEIDETHEMLGTPSEVSSEPQKELQSEMMGDEQRAEFAATPLASTIITLETTTGPDLEFDGKLLGHMMLGDEQHGRTELYQTRKGTLIVRHATGQTEVYSSDAYAEVFEIFGYDSEAKALYRAGGLRCVRWID